MVRIFIETFCLVVVAIINTILLALVLVVIARYLMSRRLGLFQDLFETFDVSLFVPLLAIFPACFLVFCVWLTTDVIGMFPQENIDKSITFFVMMCSYVAMWLTLHFS